MSHFVTYVCISPQNEETVTSDKIKDRVSELLAPFDENVMMEEYENDCYCIGNEARRDANRAADEKTGTSISKMRKQYWNLPKEEQTDKKWSEILEPWDKVRDECLDIHPLKDKPSPDCRECKGTGRYMTTYNPKSKWDWWVIGGRFDGTIRNLEPLRDGERFNFGDKFRTVERNIIKTEEFLKQLKIKGTPFALVTSSGEWFECGQMGMLGASLNKKDESDWFQEVVKLLKSEPKGSMLVSVDCHM